MLKFYAFQHKTHHKILQVLPWHLPYKWGKSTEKTSVRVGIEC